MELAVALVGAEKIVAGADGEAHEPVFEGRFAAKAREFLERLHPDFLDDILHLVFATGVAARGAEDARGIFFHQRLEARGVAPQHLGDQFRIGGFHRWRTMPKIFARSKTKATSLHDE